MKSFKFLAAALLLTSVVFTGCNKENDLFSNEASLKSATAITCGSSVTLYAGQTIDVGTVTVTHTETTIEVTYTTIEGWLLSETHLFVGSMAQLNSIMEKKVTGSGKKAVTSYNLPLGKLPYKARHDPMVSTYTYVIDRAGLSDESVVVVAHAVVNKVEDGIVLQSETAFGEGNDLPVTRWAWSFEYTYGDCITNQCIYYPEVFELYGGQSILAGNVTVVNDETNMYVTYNTTGDWFFKKTQVYVGTLAGLGIGNPQPGQFKVNGEKTEVAHNPYAQSYTYVFPLDLLSTEQGCVVIAAHAELVKVQDGVEVQGETGWSFGSEFPGATRWGWYSNYCIQFCVN